MKPSDTVVWVVALVPLIAWTLLGEGFKVVEALPAVGQLLLALAALTIAVSPSRWLPVIRQTQVKLFIAAVVVAVALALLRGENLRLITHDAVSPLAFLVGLTAVGSLSAQSQRTWWLVAMALGSLAVLKSLAIWSHGQLGVSWLNSWQAFAEIGQFWPRIVLRGGGTTMLASLVFWLTLLFVDHQGSNRLRRLGGVALLLSMAGIALKVGLAPPHRVSLSETPFRSRCRRGSHRCCACSIPSPVEGNARAGTPNDLARRPQSRLRARCPPRQPPPHLRVPSASRVLPYAKIKALNIPFS